MKKTKQTALTAAMFAAAMGMTACSQLPVQEVNSEPDIYYYSATENEPVSLSLLHGDIDGDGEISVADAVLLQKYLKNQQTFTEKQFKRADLNQDGIVNVFDTVAQKRVLIYGDWQLVDEPTETEYDPESEEQYDVYGPPAWFEDTTEPPTEQLPQPEYGPPEIFQ